MRRRPQARQDGFLEASVLSEAERRASDGALMYDLSYFLDTSRGKKTIYNSVCIANRKLYVYTLTVKEAKEEKPEEVAQVAATKALAGKLVASFDVR